MSYSYLTHLECARTGERVDADVVQNLSPAGAPLLARYDLAGVRAAVTPAEIGARAPDLWRYHELLPVRHRANVVTLGEGLTPLLPARRLGAELGVPGLLVKDEGVLPTGSFKCRGAAVGVSRAHELGVRSLAMPTNGNAGSAWTAYAARAGMRSLVVLPDDAPAITRSEMVLAGAEVYRVRGTIADAGATVARAVAARPGWFGAATLKEPYRIEGKKTMGFELAEQLGWRMPDVIVYPTGGGVGIIGIHKALTELLELGWISGTLPRLVAVQAAGCAPIVEAFRSGANHAEPWVGARTVAFGITVPSAIGDFLVLDAVRSTGGTAVTVTDDELLAAQARCTATEGLFVCPEGGAVLAAIGQLRASGWLDGSEEVVALNTGTGIKYPEAVPVDPPLLELDEDIPPPA